MKIIIKYLICALVFVLSAVSCQKYTELADTTEKDNGTINVSISGLMGEYTQVDATKSSLVNNVRVCWEGGETVYVYDGTQCLGSLVASLEGNEDRYALLSTDGNSHTILKPEEGTTKLTLVHSPLLTEAPSVANKSISVSLAHQNGAKAPFVAYATLDYNGEESITNVVAAFKFATSVIRINCTGLKANTAITSAELRNVSTKCKLTISGSSAPSVTIDDSPNERFITKVGDSYFAADKVNSEGVAVFQIAVPVLKEETSERVLTVAQDFNKFEYRNFSKKSLPATTSVNTVCQMVEKPNLFTVGNDGTTRKVYFSKGNLVATIDGAGNPTAWRFNVPQYSCISVNGANKTIGTQPGDVDLFGWSTSISNYGIKASTHDENYSGEFVDWGNVINDGHTWRTLTRHEWNYLLFERTASTVNGTPNARFVKACVNGTNGIIILPDIYVHPAGISQFITINIATASYTNNNYNTSQWEAMEFAEAIFLPAAGKREGSDVIAPMDIGYYWFSSPSISEYAYNVNFVESTLQGISQRHNGYSVRLVTDATPSTPGAVTDVTLNEISIELTAYTLGTLTATVYPSDAINKAVTWSCNNPDVAVVDDNGNVLAKTPGKAIITVTTVDGGKQSACEVTVVAAPSLPEGALNGIFTVAEGSDYIRKTHFSKGNLIAHVNDKGEDVEWKFATNQYDYLGEGGANTTIGTQPGDVDLFSWSTSLEYGIKPESYTGEFVDWGQAKIDGSESVDHGETWRTLTKDEWTFLFETRNASTVNGVDNARYVKATVCGKAGVILLPDAYVHPAEVPAFNNINPGEFVGYSQNQYNSEQWKAMEDIGAVFLPAAGYRDGSTIYGVGNLGYYWSSTMYDGTIAFNVNFDNDHFNPYGIFLRRYGSSVRLVMR